MRGQGKKGGTEVHKVVRYSIVQYVGPQRMLYIALPDMVDKSSKRGIVHVSDSICLFFKCVFILKYY